MASLLVKNLVIDEKTLTTDLDFMATQLEIYILRKLVRVNKALDKILPLRVHRKSIAIALRIFKIVLRTYTNMFIHAPILLLKLVLKFYFAESWISLLNPKKSNVGSQVFQLRDYMKCKQKKVNKALVELLPENGISQKICDAMKYSLLAGGKRIRPILCIAACEFVGGDESSAMPMACAMEIIHTASLIVDDLPCMDNDDLRRGNPSSHKMYGEDIAILASAALSCLAFEHIVSRKVEVSQDRMVHAITELASAVGLDGLVSGQFLDIDFQGKDVTLEQLKNIHVLKTGRLLEASVVCGAIIGGATASEIDKLRKYAQNIGLLFQVVDDILDATQPTTTLGKTAGKDSKSEKATFVRLMNIDKAKDYAKELVDQAVHELAHFDAVRAAPLSQLAHFILDRQY